MIDKEILEVLAPMVAEQAPKLIDALVKYIISEINTVQTDENSEFACVCFVKNPQKENSVLIALQKNEVVNPQDFILKAKNIKVITEAHIKKVLADALNNGDVKILENVITGKND